MSDEAGSAWWAELLFGTTCWVAIGVFALVHTSFGPLAEYTVTYGTLLSAAYVAVALALGAQFVRAGLRKSPRELSAGLRADDTTRDAAVVGGTERDS